MTEDVRKLAVIMFTDMVGYSTLTERDESAALEILNAHNTLVRSVLQKHGGREIKTIGDAFLVEFVSVLMAVQCAVDIQQQVSAHNVQVDPSRRFWLRIGIHLGDVLYRDGDVFGEGVNIASRIQPLSDPGGICVSEDIYNQIRSRREFRADFMGVHELKNIATPVPLYKILLGPKESAKRSFLPGFLAHRPSWLMPVVLTSTLTAVLLAFLSALFFLVLERPQAVSSDPVPTQQLADPNAQESTETPVAVATQPVTKPAAPASPAAEPPARPTPPPSSSPTTPATTEPTPAVTRPVRSQTLLQLKGSHPFEDATVFILIDGDFVKSFPLRGQKDKLTDIDEQVPVEPGDHRIEVRVRAPLNNFDRSETVRRDFERNETLTLLIKLESSGGFMGMGKSVKLQLEWLE